MDRKDEAFTTLSDELAKRRATQGNNHKDTRACMLALGMLEDARTNTEAAEALFKECIFACPTDPPPTSEELSLTSKAAKALADLLVKAGRTEEATPFNELADAHAPEEGFCPETFTPALSLAQIAGSAMMTKLWTKQMRTKALIAIEGEELTEEAEAALEVQTRARVYNARRAYNLGIGANIAARKLKEQLKEERAKEAAKTEDDA